MKHLHLLLLILTLPWLGCENILKDYQEETFTVNTFDHDACVLLETDSVAVSRSMSTLDDTSFATAADTIIYLSLDTLLVLTPSDSNSWDIHVGADVAYAVVRIVGSPATTVFFTDVSVDVTLTSADNEAVTPVNTVLSMETIADCALIRNRMSYSLAAGDYLLTIAGEDVNSVLMVIINE